MVQKNEKLFYELLQAETEEEITTILQSEKLLNDNPGIWRPYGDKPNNTYTIGNQQGEPTPAFVEKIINSIDAVLMAECWKSKINPESSSAPTTMSEAAEKFFNIRNGRLENETAYQRTKLADSIHVIVVGSKTDPNYLIVDRGEGQCPGKFSKTLLSIGENNKVGIHFVQGKYNAGGTGVLYFCGKNKYQLVVSKRHPDLPGDETKDLWGFTIVRRILPTNERLNSSFVYLAPEGQVLTFAASEIKVLPATTKDDKLPKPYVNSLEWGTCIKLYAYQFKTRGIATLEARYELEKYLYTLCLPIRLTETRDGYKANYYSTTISGASIKIADDASKSLIETGFPDSGSINIEKIGKLSVVVTVYKEKDEKGEEIGTRHIPNGICFTVNGQVHANLPKGFIDSKLDYNYISKYMIVAVDCTNMAPIAREQFFLTSRDRARTGSDEYEAVIKELITYLKEHERLTQLNAQRRLEHVKEALTDEEPLQILQDLIKQDPALASLLSLGTRIKDPFGPGKQKEPYVGKRFPTFFRIHKEPKGGLIKECPINKTCKVVFETDAVNDYFSRGEMPGIINFTEENLCKSYNLCDGRLYAKFILPESTKIGDIIHIVVTVTDETQAEPFACKFKIKAIKPEIEKIPPPPHPHLPKGINQLAMPQIIEVREDKWQEYDFDKFSGIKIQKSGEEGGFDIFVNMDNIYLLNELKYEIEGNKDITRYWFKYGLVLVTMGMLHEYERTKDERKLKENTEVSREGQDYLEEIGKISPGVACVIVPIIRRLSEGPPRT
jgi:hypothetical protein